MVQHIPVAQVVHMLLLNSLNYDPFLGCHRYSTSAASTCKREQLLNAICQKGFSRYQKWDNKQTNKN